MIKGRNIEKENQIKEAIRKLGKELEKNLPKELDSFKNREFFYNCFVNTAETTLRCLGEDECFLITGDINAMWLRDSSAQVCHYLKYIEKVPEIRELIRGLIVKQFRFIQIDPYANAFNVEPNGACWAKDDTDSDSPWLWERKYELDSLCYPITLLYKYYEATKDSLVLTDEIFNGIQRVLKVMVTEQHHEDSSYYFIRANCPETDTLPGNGKGNPVVYTGMIWSGFRPSDDACKYGYNIPENILATTALKNIVTLSKVAGKHEIAQIAEKLLAEVTEGIEKYGKMKDAEGNEIYAYEVDGLGNQLFMDDANVPSLLSIPWISDISEKDELYLNTRRAVLSAENPYYYEGVSARGIGSPHTPKDYIWHISLSMQGLTSTQNKEKIDLINEILNTDAGTGYTHEGFHKDDPSKYTRDWFAWSNSLFASLVCTVLDENMVEEGVHNYSREESYVYPEDPAVREKLEWFKDQKLALMMHWGAYSQIGVVESWALSDEDGDWSRTEIDWTEDKEEFKRQYFGLNKTFNPIRFQPEKWAKAASGAGFKYFIFTTKHHDGFCMWDTQYTDYKITGQECPYREGRHADICKDLFDEMRKEGLGITAYFSKADWHCPYYWNNKYEKGNDTWRGPSYDPEKYPEIWKKFEEYTHAQVHELADNYGPIDAFWFDAGWVCEKEGEDIHLGELMDKVREKHPGVLSVDRTIGGKYENYVTPEQCVPEKPLMIPWESCITMGTSFSFKYEDKYKSVREIICLLTDIVAKGGNLALNVGPQPDGRIPEGALRTMTDMGKWLSKYGEAIYATRVCSPYKEQDVCFTKKKDNSAIYAIKQYREENMKAQNEVFIPQCENKDIKEIIDLYTGNKVRFDKGEGGYTVYLDEVEECAIAQVFKLI